MEKRLAPGTHLAQPRLRVITPLQHRMEQQGEQVEAEHHRREGVLAMPNVVLHMVAFGLEHMVVFLVALPPPTACVRHRRDVLCRDAVIGEKALVGELCARCGVDHRDVAPIDRQGLFPVEQEHVLEHAIPGHCRAAAMPVTACTRGDAVVGVPKGDTCVQRGRGIGLAPQDAGAALCQRQGTQGLRAVQLIPQEGHLMRRTRLGMLPSPACAGHLLAVLCVRAIVRQDVLGREGEDWCASWAHHHRCDGWVRRQRVPVRELTRETVGALEGLGGQGGRAIECHQALIPEDPETLAQVRLGKALNDCNKDGVARARGDRIEEGTEVMIAGNRRDAHQRVGVIAPLVFLEPALVLSKRGRLGKEDATGTSRSLGHTVWCIAALTTVGQWLDPVVEHGPEILKA